MSQRTVITGGILVTDSDEIRADLVIDDQQIVAMLDDATGVDTDEHIDATDLLVMPAGVDLYGPSPEATAASRTVAAQRAAAAGGFSTLVADMDKAAGDEGAQSNQTADIAYWYPIPGGTLPTAEQLSRMAQTGIAGFSGTMRGEGPESSPLSDAEVLAIMKLLARLDVPFAITPIHPSLKISDPLAEISAVTTSLLFAEHTGAWLHLRNLTTGAAMHQVADARTRGVRVTASVSALHLALAASDASRLVKARPPLRPQETIDDLWPFVMDESVDCIGSLMVDRRGRTGVPVTDTQTVLPLFWDEAVHRRKMSRSQAVRMFSTNAARISGLHPRKGTIRVGSDADLVLFDPLGMWTVSSREILTEEHWSPVEGREVTGFVVRTLRRGTTIYDADRHDDESLLPVGSGKLLSRI